ncbi:MAG: ATP-binding protein [Phycisphaerae bacterium]
MAMQPWYKVVYPREDLREGRPMDASEFAVHLDQVRDKRANSVYQDPVEFFQRTYLTKNLLTTAGEVIRRLNGIKTETSAVFNMTTQFGGGKTHALTLMYHLATGGDKAKSWAGVDSILKQAEVDTVPEAEVGVFVGTEFDSISGRGKEGEPNRKTPWGELAWQIGGQKAFDIVAEHEKQLTAPSGEVIRKFLPKDKPCLILMDELMNYVSRCRKSGLSAQLYNFLQNLSETVRGEDNCVLVVSIPASELEMSGEDQADYDRFKKLLDRLGKPVIMAANGETSEIIRRRLFEWDGITKDSEKTVMAYTEWVNENRTQVPGWFPVDNAREAFRKAYPFHPVVLSVFERKWQQLPRFQQTRGVLRLLALWVSNAYKRGYEGAHKDALIGLGTAPLDDSFFRMAAFEQLGESRLEGAVTTDITGKDDSHSERLDTEAVDAIKKARLHRKVATSIFFESNGGQMKHEATVPELRLAVGEPDMDIGNVETVLDTLSESCYYLTVERNRYRFSTTENLIKRYSDRRASVDAKTIDDRVKEEIQKVFQKDTTGTGVDVRFFPEKTNDIADRPALTLAVLASSHSMEDAAETKELAKKITWECGKSGRTFKSGIVWAVPESEHALREEARKTLAWQAIKDEESDLNLEESQRRQLEEQLRRAKRDLTEVVWRTYKNLLLLGKDNEMRHVDLGLVNSSQAGSMLEVVLKRMREDGDLEKAISPNFLIRKWPGMTEWSTKAVRDAFFASPLFPRLLNGDVVKETIARGVSQGLLAYVGKAGDGQYKPFHFEEDLTPADIDITDELFIVTAEEAKKHIEPPKLAVLQVSPERQSVKPNAKLSFSARGLDQHGRTMQVNGVAWEATGGEIDDKGVFSAGEDEGQFSIKAVVEGIEGGATVFVTAQREGDSDGNGDRGDAPPPPQQTSILWSGQVPAQKWMNFYTKVLAKYATSGEMTVTVSFDVKPEGGVTPQGIEETRSALRELGLDDALDSQ